MNNFKQNKKSHFGHSPLFLGFILCVILIFSYNLIILIKKEKETTKKKEMVLNQIDALDKREKLISNDIEKLKTDEGIEESIRDKYQVAREGEKVVSIVDPQQQETIEDQTVVDHSFWGYIKKIFKK